PRICLSAQGERLTQRCVEELAQLPGVLLIAGRYEGLDERVFRLGVDRELSVGDYVLSGGELPALTLIDAVARLLPGVLGDERSSVEESFAQGLLEGPHYTRPEVFEGLAVPAPLLSGNHADIRRWRLRQAVIRTWSRRPDLVAAQGLAPDASRELDDYLAARRRGGTDVAASGRGAIDEEDGHEQDRSGN
ncbi:MAG TPA: tRNA (guanosine(37)-N1)-methyltransferase TrmD, partial [Steroidobacteraceae bacterium]|nr:tRNA (guanosine(37)-N1)-methyltransferase TrmD [Steroidobacteraceae bacterium]